MRQTIPILAWGLMMACGQADAPLASKPVAEPPAVAVDPAPTPAAAAPRADGRVAVTITYCIP